MNMLISSAPWVSNLSEWSLNAHILWFTFRYLISLLVTSRHAAPEHFKKDVAGWVKINKVLEIVLVLRLFVRDDGRVLIYALINQIILQFGAIRFIVMTAQNPSAVAEYSRVFSSIFILTMCITFVGMIVCRCVYLLLESRGKK